MTPKEYSLLLRISKGTSLYDYTQLRKSITHYVRYENRFVSIKKFINDNSFDSVRNWYNYYYYARIKKRAS